jgi:hypothetical protein
MYPETSDQVANLSVAAYGYLKPFADDGGWWFLAQELSSDELSGPTRGADWYDGGKWINVHRHTWSNDEESVNRMWSSMWEGIIGCNKILDKMNGIPPSDALKSKQAEVRAVRAFFYWCLIDNYGDVPYLTTQVNAPALPFRLHRTAVFDSLIKTLTSDLPLLKPIDRKNMMNRYAAEALLAKLYLNAEVYTGTAHWAEAEQFCDSVLAGPYTFDQDFLAPFKTQNENDPEIIFSIPYDENTFQGFRLHMRTLHYQMNLTYDMPVGPWNGFAVTPTFFDTYQDIDKRKAGYNIWGPIKDKNGAQITDGTTHTPLIIDPHLPALYMQPPAYSPTQIRMSGARVVKYEIKMGAKENLSNDLPIFRLTDMMLTKAELRIRQGGNGDEYVNPIRERAGVPAWTNVGLDSLLAERGREMYCEGVRRMDLIRFGKFDQAWWEKDASGPERRTFPIPKYASDVNPNLLPPK